VEFTYSPHGYESIVRYLDRQHQLQLGCGDVFGKRQTFDERGLVIKSTLLDRDSQQTNHKDKIATERYVYDKLGNVIEEAYFGLDGKPSLTKWGDYHRVSKRYDERGNVIEEAYFGLDGKPSNMEGKFSQKYDERDNLIHKAYFDETGNPITHSQYGFHRLAQKYGEQDNFLEFAVFDVAGNPTTYKDGYHKFTKKIAENGRQIEWAYFDVANNPIIPKDVSYHKLVKKFDEPGSAIEWAYFDVGGNLTKKYDKDGNLIE